MARVLLKVTQIMLLKTRKKSIGRDSQMHCGPIKLKSGMINETEEMDTRVGNLSEM